MLKRSWAALAFVLACAVSGVAQEQPAFSIPFRELESYTKGGRQWRGVVVDPKIKRDDLVKLARERAHVPQKTFWSAILGGAFSHLHVLLNRSRCGHPAPVA